ncbi:hypothetical protein [Natrialba sp. SSL1]|uniref:hypothetical protein n=1 Tax=Natrialba sp. SSL1 TaxID=1869245 RepID=UPI0008F8E8AF|nr:hypothetical protein [Natrialba sp. SSL1]OIB55568.1 hypothetical protein BBD46_04510 [Natrialba sp. SSL1]
MNSTVLRAVFPDRPPTKTDVVAGGLAGGLALLHGTWPAPGNGLRWEWIALGFVLGAIVLGPVAQSPVGKRIGTMARDLSIAARLVVIAIVITVTLVLATVVFPDVVFRNVSIGILAVIPFYVVGHVAVARELGGWKPASESDS